MPRIRLAFAALFGVVGAILFALWMPTLLDSLYVFVQEQATPEDVPVEVAPLETDRVVPDGSFVGPRESAPEFDVTPLAEAIDLQEDEYEAARRPATLAAMALLGFIFGSAFGNALAARLMRGIGRWDQMPTGQKVTLFVALILGIVASLPFLFVFQTLGGVAGPFAIVAVTVAFCALSVFAMKSMEEVLPWHNREGNARRSGIKVLDTNVLIDGRIIDLARTGFLEGQLYVADFVLKELQYIADSSDALRRQRGRRGLDVLRLMQDEFDVTVGSYDRLATGPRQDVDGRLVSLAKALHGDLVSNDFNLNRVASIQDVRVLNINDLALALRPNVLPGEELDVQIIREGSQHEQGVAYLEDGTMVVVERGKPYIGDRRSVIVTQVIQTERGKMIFADAELEEDSADAAPPTRRRRAR